MTDLSVVPFPAPTVEAEDAINVAKGLADLLARGDVESFACVAVHKDGTVTYARGLPLAASRYALLGALTQQVHRLAAYIEAEQEASG